MKACSTPPVTLTGVADPYFKFTDRWQCPQFVVNDEKKKKGSVLLGPS